MCNFLVIIKDYELGIISVCILCMRSWGGVGWSIRLSLVFGRWLNEDIDSEFRVCACSCVFVCVGYI